MRIAVLPVTVATLLALTGCQGKPSGLDAGTDAGPIHDGGTDAGNDAGPNGDGGMNPADAYLVGCKSFFAARTLEKQRELDSTFPNDCDAPLKAAIGKIAVGGKALCAAGESANACQQRLYATPPAMSDREPGCAVGSPTPKNCLVGKNVPRCADGTETCAEPQAICQDGTRPFVYVEPATAGASDVWFFWLGGEGGPCTGPTCWLYYRFGPQVDKAEHQQAMSTAHPDNTYARGKAGGGVTNGTVVPENPFAQMNRVRFKRCTDAASNATEDAPIGDGVPASAAAEYPTLPIATRTAKVPVFHHGFDTWRATFRSFTTPAGRDLDGDGTPDLPSLANAKTVVLAGSSDASQWVISAGDELAKELRAIAGPSVDVRLMVDGHFEPALDNEGRYDAGVPAGFDAFHQPYSKTHACTLPDNADGIANETCSDKPYGPGGAWRKALDTRGVVRDASCEAMHGANAPECYDGKHTLLHHVATPVLILSDQEDHNISGSPPIYAEDSSYHWASPPPYRRRVLDLAHDIESFWATSAREEGAGTPGNFALALPKSRRTGEPWANARHVRFHDDVEMQKGMTRCSQAGTKLGTVAFGTMVGTWVLATLPNTFAIEDGTFWGGVGAYTVTGDTCRPPE
ncbi:MAG: hypothetical protein K1X89_02995 [Myxococcaceae bacterium]|nr:hypothetical protein [Myxococcaceae bacterium]